MNAPEVLGPDARPARRARRGRPGAGAGDRHRPGRASRSPRAGCRSAGSSCRSRWSRSCAPRPTRTASRSSSATWPTSRVPGEFSLVYLVFNTISNLLEQSEQVACFRNAAAHLRPGGRFVVELGVPDLQRLPPDRDARDLRGRAGPRRARHVRRRHAAPRVAPLPLRRRARRGAAVPQPAPLRLAGRARPDGPAGRVRARAPLGRLVGRAVHRRRRRRTSRSTASRRPLSSTVDGRAGLQHAQPPTTAVIDGRDSGEAAAASRPDEQVDREPDAAAADERRAGPPRAAGGRPTGRSGHRRRRRARAAARPARRRCRARRTATAGSTSATSRITFLSAVRPVQHRLGVSAQQRDHEDAGTRPEVAVVERDAGARQRRPPAGCSAPVVRPLPRARSAAAGAAAPPRSGRGTAPAGRRGRRA